MNMNAYWITPAPDVDDEHRDDYSECSKCGNVVFAGEEPDECPFCGAPMGLTEEEALMLLEQKLGLDEE